MCSGASWPGPCWALDRGTTSAPKIASTERKRWGYRHRLSCTACHNGGGNSRGRGRTTIRKGIKPTKCMRWNRYDRGWSCGSNGNPSKKRLIRPLTTIRMRETNGFSRQTALRQKMGIWGEGRKMTKSPSKPRFPMTKSGQKRSYSGSNRARFGASAPKTSASERKSGRSGIS